MATQLRIVGTENRSDNVPPVLDEAGQKWLADRREARRARDKAKDGKQACIALMQLHKIPAFKIKDTETDEYLELELDLEPKLRATKSGEVDSPVGDGLPAHAGATQTDGVPSGLIAQAERAQADMNVEEVDGDVVVPDTAAPKKKRSKRKPAATEPEAT